MKISYAWLNSFFDEKLPPVGEVVDALTFHAWEAEDIEQVGEDTVFEVKVLPDRTPHALSHRGIAKELGAILGITLSRDPMTAIIADKKAPASLSVSVSSDACTRYQGAVIEGVRVGPSPAWLRERLESLGQRSINNIVDATNYVMFDLGQPLHAFDADKLDTENGAHAIEVRIAREGEEITTLTGETYALTPGDLLIVDGVSDVPIGIAGIKGGKHAEVGAQTTCIIIEAAHFDRVRTRKSSQQLKLRTDASTRFENGIVPEMTEPALAAVVALIMDIAGGTFRGVSETPYTPSSPRPVSITLARLSAALGIDIPNATAAAIMDRFGYPYELSEDTLTVTPPIERTDLVIPEDLIEEVGRMHGYEHIPSVVPHTGKVPELNKRFYYSEVVRNALTQLGFSEIYTSSFRPKDIVRMKNALASDKAYLRSLLHENLKEALEKNVPNRDLLGLSAVALFELGAVFPGEGERFALALGVRHGMEYREKLDKKRLDEACETVAMQLGIELTWRTTDGIAELDLGALLSKLPEPTAYTIHALEEPKTYVPFSVYPAVSRDIALWVPEGRDVDVIAERIDELAGDLLARLTLFDTFTKEGRTSYAFRLVFQSGERTLTDTELIPVMERITRGLAAEGYMIR